MDQIVIGKYGLPLLITAILAFVFGFWSNPDLVPNYVKRITAVGTAMLLCLLALFYQAATPVDPVNPAAHVAVNLISVVNYLVMGFILGTSAIGINQLGKSGPATTSLGSIRNPPGSDQPKPP